MFRKDSTVAELEVRRELLEAELAELRGLPYIIWRDVVGRSMCKSTVGRNDRRYRLSVTPSWAVAGSRDVRVTVALETNALHRPLLRHAFVITPANELRESQRIPHP